MPRSSKLQVFRHINMFLGREIEPYHIYQPFLLSTAKHGGLFWHGLLFQASECAAGSLTRSRVKIRYD